MMISPSAPNWPNVSKCIYVAFSAGIQDLKVQPARAGRRLQIFKSVSLLGSEASSTRFGATAPVIWVTPVTLPPGRPKLVTSPSLTGSPAGGGKQSES